MKVPLRPEHVHVQYLFLFLAKLLQVISSAVETTILSLVLGLLLFCEGTSNPESYVFLREFLPLPTTALIVHVAMSTFSGGIMMNVFRPILLGTTPLIKLT